MVGTRDSKLAGVIKRNLAQIKRMFKTYGVVSAYVFGSAATGKMTKGSDVDFLIRFSPELDINTYGTNYFNLLYELQDLLRKDVDLVAEETVTNPYLLETINQQKILVYNS